MRRYAPLAKEGSVAIQLAEQYQTQEQVALASVEASRKQVAASEAALQRAQAQIHNVAIKASDRLTLVRQVDECFG